jgi:hypothetical protein
MRDATDLFEESPAPPPVSSLRFFTSLIGALDDGSEIELFGGGTINEREGITLGEFDIRKLPATIAPPALGPFLFTGYPNACATRSAGGTNPFSGVSYSYTRRYHFHGSSDIARLRVECRLDTAKNELISTFLVGGSMPRLDSVSSVTPITESWTPRGWSLMGRFQVGWVSTDGSTVTAEAVSDYVLPPEASPAHSTLQRYLHLTSSISPSGRFEVRQRSYLAGDSHQNH